MARMRPTDQRLQIQLPEKLAVGALLLDQRGQLVDRNTLLLHGVAVTHRHGVVFERLTVPRSRRTACRRRPDGGNACRRNPSRRKRRCNRISRGPRSSAPLRACRPSSPAAERRPSRGPAPQADAARRASRRLRAAPRYRLQSLPAGTCGPRRSTSRPRRYIALARFGIEVLDLAA